MREKGVEGLRMGREKFKGSHLLQKYVTSGFILSDCFALINEKEFFYYFSLISRYGPCGYTHFHFILSLQSNRSNILQNIHF